MDHVNRLSYIGSKYKLLDWIDSIIKIKCGETKSIADLFSGTGIVTYYFRLKGYTTVSNDSELYSSIITGAMALSEHFDHQFEDANYTGFITKNYSPYGDCERMFFTVENAQKIDYVHRKIHELHLTPEMYNYLMACLLVSADAVSNTAAVYGSYLKQFKKSALKPFVFKYIHTLKTPASPESVVFNDDIVNLDIPRVDIVYLDPPYNERQYSKNYFPLNVLALTPAQQSDKLLKGKTGIPENCFISKFCKPSKVVESEFRVLFEKLRTKTKWIFLSYNSESTVSKTAIIKIMESFGTVDVFEKEYKRFKAYNYNEDKQISEYLFCLKIA